MIRVRFEGGGDPLDLGASQYVEITEDDGVLTPEKNKNRPEDFAVVEQHLRPHFMNEWATGTQLFDLVAIETRSGCNYGCSFCPVARHADPRPHAVLPWALLRKVAVELHVLRFRGRILLFGNNEPLLDPRIVDVTRLFRLACPDAEVRLLTNGSLLSVTLARELFDAGLTTLTVNNYTDGRRLIKPVRALLEAAPAFRHRDVRVSVRYRDQKLTTRAGLAPNKPYAEPGLVRGFCALPFTDINVTSAGDIVLCCFDAIGRQSMGSVKTASLVEIWQGQPLMAYREKLMARQRVGICEQCDFDGFRAPNAASPRPLTRAGMASGASDG